MQLQPTVHCAMSLESRLRGCEVELSTVDGRIRGVVAGVNMSPGGKVLSDVLGVDLIEVWDISLGCHVHGMQRFDYTDNVVFEKIKWRSGEEVEPAGDEKGGVSRETSAQFG